MQRIRSYHCSGQVTTAGVSRELSRMYLESTYLDLTIDHNDQLTFSFRMNGVDAGYLDVSTFVTRLATKINKNSFSDELTHYVSGKIPTFSQNKDTATLSDDYFLLLARPYGPPDTCALQLTAPAYAASSPPSLNVFLTPQQTRDLAQTVQQYNSNQNQTQIEDDLVLVNGDTQPVEPNNTPLAPP